MRSPGREGEDHSRRIIGAQGGEGFREHGDGGGVFLGGCLGSDPLEAFQGRRDFLLHSKASHGLELATPNQPQPA
jgi:hypothetical protein